MKTRRFSVYSVILGLVIALAMAGCKPSSSSRLQPGYDRAELSGLLPAMERTYDSADIGGFKTPEPEGLKRIFRSSVTPLLNRFDVWQTSGRQDVITFRGTIVDTAALSFSAAFYCLMVPATGTLRISDSRAFDYKLTELGGAGVHLGILLGLALLSDELKNQVMEQYKEGIRDFILVGHSQGSGTSLLATAWLLYLQKEGKIPADIRFKTYSIATPKVGNYQFVCDFERVTAGGYALSVDNVIDWVPSIAMTFQAPGDFPAVSPFKDLKGFFQGINYSPGSGFDTAYSRFAATVPELSGQVIRMVRENVYPRIHRALPGFTEPAIITSFNYERAGVHVPLVPDSTYFRLFPNNPDHFQVWENHSVYPYYVLVSGK